MFDRRWSGYTPSTFIAMHFSPSLFYCVSCFLTMLLYQYSLRSIVSPHQRRRGSIFHASTCARKIIICYDCQQHFVCSGFFLVLVHHSSRIPRAPISVPNRSISFPNCCHWIGICAEFGWLPFWAGLECFSNHDTSIL